MGLKFKKIPTEQITVNETEICIKGKCQKQAKYPNIRKKLIVAYEVESKNEKEYVILGQEKESGDFTAILYDSNMKIKKMNDSKRVDDYTDFAKLQLNSRKQFREESDVGKARITYQLLQHWD